MYDGAMKKLELVKKQDFLSSDAVDEYLKMPERFYARRHSIKKALLSPLVPRILKARDGDGNHARNMSD